MEKENYPTYFDIHSTVLPKNTEILEGKYYSLIPQLKIDCSQKKISEFPVNAEWCNLYNSWNLCFVCANLDSIFLPLKLMIPSIFSAQPKHYKEVRVLSLYLVSTLFLNEKINQNPFFSEKFNFTASERILKQWAEINNNYATNLLIKHFPNDSISTKTIYQKVFGESPTYHLLKSLTSYLYNSDQFYIIFPPAFFKQHPQEKNTHKVIANENFPNNKSRA